MTNNSVNDIKEKDNNTKNDKEKNNVTNVVINIALVANQTLKAE